MRWNYLFTLLACTEPSERGCRGLSRFLAPKPRGSDAAPFPAEGMGGTEILVHHYCPPPDLRAQLDRPDANPA